MDDDTSDVLNPYQSPHTADFGGTRVPATSNPDVPMSVTVLKRGWAFRRLRFEGLIEAELFCTEEFIRVNGRRLSRKLFCWKRGPFEFDIGTPSRSFAVEVHLRPPFLYPFVPLHVRVYVDGELVYSEG